jgi:hypothetical protein
VSRRDGRPVAVVVDPAGRPLCVSGSPVHTICGFWREWIGALEGEPERDIWRVVTDRGIVELHRLHAPVDTEASTGGHWLLATWED